MEGEKLDPCLSGMFWGHTRVRAQGNVVGAAGVEGGKHESAGRRWGQGRRQAFWKGTGPQRLQGGEERTGQEVTRAFVRHQGAQGSSLVASCLVRGHLPAFSSIPDYLPSGPGPGHGSCGHRVPLWSWSARVNVFLSLEPMLLLWVWLFLQQSKGSLCAAF